MGRRGFAQPDVSRSGIESNRSAAEGELVIERWLTERTTLEAAEERFRRLTGSPLWKDFRAKYRDGDELWYFRSPAETWPRKCGAAGVAIMRGGQVAAHFVALRS
jgi:hypothetical protein